MRDFSYERAAADAAPGALLSDGDAVFLAGGTTLLDLMKLDVLRPSRVVNIGDLAGRYGKISVSGGLLRLGGLVRMAEAADHADVLHWAPAIAESLRAAASPQLRNMATLAGNVLQRTRCAYFRDVSWPACNKRAPGSGCAALEGVNRRMAVLGGSSHCIAHYPGDFANVLAAFGAEVEILTATGETRSMQFEDLHRLPGDTPERETNLQPGDLITGFQVPVGAWTQRSVYVKIRDRASYDFAQASAAVGLELDGGVIKTVRIGLGGVAAKPWRSHESEKVLQGQTLSEDLVQHAAVAAFAGAATYGENDFKPELGRRTLVRAVFEAARLEV
jgi:xanthine dehydrogenase YagS FAD-binding subunit